MFANMKIMGAAAIMLALAACDTGTTAPPASGDAPVMVEAPTTVEGVVEAAQADIGKDIGGGVTLIGAEADGNVVRFSFQYVATLEQLQAIGLEAFSDGFTSGFVGSLCSNPAVTAFVAGGGEIAVTMVDPNGAQIIGRRVTSC